MFFLLVSNTRMPPRACYSQKKYNVSFLATERYIRIPKLERAQVSVTDRQHMLCYSDGSVVAPNAVFTLKKLLSLHHDGAGGVEYSHSYYQ